MSEDQERKEIAKEIEDDIAKTIKRIYDSMRSINAVNKDLPVEEQLERQVAYLVSELATLRVTIEVMLTRLEDISTTLESGASKN